MKSMKDLNEQISSVKKRILRIKQQRLASRQELIENSVSLAQRQDYCRKEINRIQHSRISRPRVYNHAIKELSKLGDTQYIIDKEAAVCHVLHHIEIGTKQMHLLRGQSKNAIKTLKKAAIKEINSQKRTELGLVRRIDIVSTDINTLIEEKNKVTWDLKGDEIVSKNSKNSSIPENIVLPSKSRNDTAKEANIITEVLAQTSSYISIWKRRRKSENWILPNA